jgi:hypothetical protein
VGYFAEDVMTMADDRVSIFISHKIATYKRAAARIKAILKREPNVSTCVSVRKSRPATIGVNGLRTARAHAAPIGGVTPSIDGLDVDRR